MTKLTIEGLKQMYAAIEYVIVRNEVGIKEREECGDAFSALNEMCRIILSSQTTYEGMTPAQLVMHVEEDLRFVSGNMTGDEEIAHVKYHYDLIDQQEKELQEYMNQQKESQCDARIENT